MPAISQEKPMDPKPALFRNNLDERQTVFLTEAEHAKADSAYCMVGAMIIIVDRENGTVYLAKNTDSSLPNWYGFTGRFFAGELEEAATQRIFRSNTGLNLPVDRFDFVCMNRCIWTNRRKEPKEFGRDRLYYTYAVELTASEMKQAQIGLKPRKYERRSLHHFTWDQLHDRGIHESVMIFHRRVFPIGFAGNPSPWPSR